MNIKNALLMGTAIVAVSAFSTQAQAGAGAAGATVLTTGSLGATTGGNGTLSADDAAGFAGGDAVDFGAANITLTGTGAFKGGNGDVGAADANNNGGNDGGIGGSGVSFAGFSGASATSLTSLINNVSVTGGNGGNGSVAQTTGAGGAGGAGGIGVFNNANFSSITGSGTITGGNGGTGAAGSSGGAGGDAGGGGDAVVITGANAVFNGTGAVKGGNGGNGGTDGGTAAAGFGGDGGNGINIVGNTGTVTITGNVTGGNGGAGGAASGVGATAGNGGNAGAGILVGGTGDAITIKTGATVTGGVGGAAGATNGGTAGTAGLAGNAVDLVGTGAALTNKGTINGLTAVGLNVASPAALATLDNTGGTITSANVTAGQGTVVLGADEGAGGLTLTGGAISNTAANNAAVALQIGADQTGAITNAGAITANGTGSALGVAVNFGGNATLTNAANGTITGQILESGNQAVTLNNAGTIHGAITLGGTGGATLSNSGTIDGNVSLTGAVANTFTLTGGTLIGSLTYGNAANVLTISGGILAGNVDMGGNANNTLNINGNYTTDGTITATGGSINATVSAGDTFSVNNTLALGGGTLTDNGTMAISSLGNLTTTGNTLVSSTGVLNVGGNSTVGALTNDGSITISSGKTLTAASFTGDAGSALTIQVARSAGTQTGGELVSTGSAVDLSNTTLNISVAGSSQPLVAGSTIIIANGNAPGTVPVTAIKDNSLIYDFSVATAGNNLTVTVTQPTSFVADTTNSNNARVAPILLNNLANTHDAQLNAVQNKLINASSRAAFNNALEATLPTVDGGSMLTAIDMIDGTLDVTDKRMAAVRSGTQTGASAGDPGTGSGLWLEAFGQHANQDEKDSVAGYSARTWGGVIGLDSSDTLDNGLVGADFAYSRADVDSDNANSTHTIVDSYQLTLYGTKYLDHQVFVNGLLASAWDHDKSTRFNVGGVDGLDAQGHYTALQGAARLATGRDFSWGGTMLTPTIVGDYLYFHPKNFTESGAGGADLNTDYSNFNQLDLGVNLKAGWRLKDAVGDITSPDIHAGYRYDLLNDDVQATSNFIGGGPAFVTEGLTPGRSVFNIGADLKYATPTSWEFSAGYDFEARSGYTANSGIIRTGYKF